MKIHVMLEEYKFNGYMTLLGFCHLTMAPVPMNNPRKFLDIGWSYPVQIFRDYCWRPGLSNGIKFENVSYTL